MSALALGIATALVALRCELIRDDPYTLGSISRVIPSTRPAFIDALNKTRRAIGCPVDDDVQEPPPPFPGGQCPFRYRVEYVGTGPTGIQGGTTCVGQTSRAGFTEVWGPIGGLQVVTQSCTGGPGGSGSIKGFSSFGSAGGARRTTPTVTTIGGVSYSDFAISAVIPLDGPDDCGNLPPVYPPPIFVPRDIDITYEGDDGPINVNIPFVFAPITANFNGTLRIPVTFSLGGLEFTGDINLPDFNFTLNPPALPPGSGDDLEPVGPDEEGETVPPLPPGQKIIGVAVNSTIVQEGRVGSIDFTNAPDIIVPRAASVKFAYSIGVATFWSSDIDVKTLRAFIPCPFSQGADAVVVTPYIGVESRSVPIQGFALSTANDIFRILDEI